MNINLWNNICCQNLFKVAERWVSILEKLFNVSFFFLFFNPFDALSSFPISLVLLLCFLFSLPPFFRSLCLYPVFTDHILSWAIYFTLYFCHWKNNNVYLFTFLSWMNILYFSFKIKIFCQLLAKLSSVHEWFSKLLLSLWMLGWGVGGYPQKGVEPPTHPPTPHKGVGGSSPLKLM